MGLKADNWIRRAAQEHGMIEPFEDAQVREGVISYGVSSYGYDIRVADEFKIFTNVHSRVVDPKAFDPQAYVDFKVAVCTIPPNSFVLARVNVDILGSRELKWTGMGEFNSDDHYIYYCGQESLRRNGVAIMVNKRVRNAVLGCNLKNNRMISVHFQGKPFNITVIQVYAPISYAEEAEVEWFYEDLQDLLELKKKK